MRPLSDHIAIIVAGLAPGTHRLPPIANDPEPGSTARAMGALGARVTDGADALTMTGTGNGCLLAADAPLRFSGMGHPVLLVAGLVASYDMKTVIVSDTAVEAGTLAATVAALRAHGVQIAIDDGTALTMTVEGPPSTHPVAHHAAGWPDVAVAATVLAALNTPGCTTLAGMAANPAALLGPLLAVDAGVRVDGDGRTWRVTVTGQRRMTAGDRP